MYYEGWVTDADKVVALHGKATVTCYGTRRSQSHGGRDKENTGENTVILRLRDTPRPLTSKQKWLPEKNTRSIALVGLAEYSAAYPVRAETALRLQQKRWLDALP